MESKQKLFYLPEAHTDFIYAVICEELGFLGAIIVVALFAAYGWRGLRAAFGAPDGFGRLLAFGITAMVLCQALINFAVVLGMVPTKGIPLPFVSYGGSGFFVVVFLAAGVLDIFLQGGGAPSGWTFSVGGAPSLRLPLEQAAPLLGRSVNREAPDRGWRYRRACFSGNCYRQGMAVAGERKRSRVSGNTTRN